MAHIALSMSRDKKDVYRAWFEDPLGRPRRRWEVHCCVHKIPPNYIIPNRISAVHTLLSHYCDIFLDIIHPSVSRSVHFIISLYKFCTYPSPVHINKYTSFGAN